jgi:CRISPR/Cas system CSM-associated protein Csm3 (group 7 of RAMP superfamily)
MKISKEMNSLFGFQKEEEGIGSRIIFTDALMVGKTGKVLDGLECPDFKDPFYNHFQNLPIRQHTRINEKGTTIRTGKFDEQVVFKGSRFLFEIEVASDESRHLSDLEDFHKVIQTLSSPSLRLGSGTRKGFGKLSVKEIQTAELDLNQKEDIQLYLEKDNCLSQTWKGFQNKDLSDFYPSEEEDNQWEKYSIDLQPDDFFSFGSGLGDNDADKIPVREDYIIWSNSIPEFIEDGLLIPASSIKGALSHRIAYRWNQLEKHFADKNALPGCADSAITALFGSSETGNNQNITRGNVIFSDLIQDKTSDKIFNHIKIDRFTGGTIDGALYTEKVTNGCGLHFKMEIDVNSSAFAETSPKTLNEEDTTCQDNTTGKKETALKGTTLKTAFETALNDLCFGLLPLGGGTCRGLGHFNGSWTSKA